MEVSKMGNNDDADRLIVTVDEARRMMGLSRGSMYQAINTGQVPSIRVGRRILIPRARLEQILNGMQQGEKSDSDKE
jgi:excisionase family DNA binding protein